MARSHLMTQLARAIRIAHFADRNHLSTREGLERAAELEHAAKRRINRREVLTGLGAAAATAGLGALAGPASARRNAPDARVAIVGGGLAGLVCADRLRSKGLAATIYEANPSRVGGRCFSNRSLVPGQVCENGGELIDNLHKTMLGYANELGLAKEDLGKAPGHETFFFGGQHRTEAEVVDEYREFARRARPDMRAISGSPTFFDHTDADVALDHVTLEEYLATRAEGLPLVQAALGEAYLAEYGRELAEQSCLNLLLFLHLDARSHFLPFGVFSDERYHLVGGNDAIADGIANRLPGPIELGRRLTRLGRDANGEYVLTFANGSARADFVVLAVPFSVLRNVTLDASLGLSADKRRAIAEMGYGYNVKTMVAFGERTWTDHGGNGTAYSDLENVQNTWETNYSQAGATSIITDYASGDRGVALRALNGEEVATGGLNHAGAGVRDARAEREVNAFIADFDRVFPGAGAAALRSGGRPVYSRTQWVQKPYSLGSYTCYLPGQFTTIAGLEGQSADRLKFAGEHANSFYEWQGFMEGACLSGIAAADEILSDLRR